MMSGEGMLSPLPWQVALPSWRLPVWLPRWTPGLVLRLVLVFLLVTLSVLTGFALLARMQAVSSAPMTIPTAPHAALQSRPILETARAHALPSSLVASTLSTGRLAVFALGSDGSLLGAFQQAPGQGWSALTTLGRPAPVTLEQAPVVVALPAGMSAVVALGTDHQLYQMVQQTATTWSDWQHIGAPLAGVQSQPQILRLADGHLLLAVLGQDGHLYLTTGCATGCLWSGFTPVT